MVRGTYQAEDRRRRRKAELAAQLAAAVSGYHSADGTMVAFNTGRYLPEVIGWLATLERQPALPGLAAPVER